MNYTIIAKHKQIGSANCIRIYKTQCRYIHTLIQGTPSFGFIPHGYHHVSQNSQTSTGNTRQSEPQLKECLCSSSISSNNSMDAIPSHNSRNVTRLPFIPSHNSRNAQISQSLRYHPKPCRPCIYPKHTNHCPTLWPGCLTLL